MDDQGHVRLESELKTTETLLEADFTNWGTHDRLPREIKLDVVPEYRRWPYFTKRVMKGSMHHTPQSVICVPTPFMRQHPDTFQAGKLITLEGPSGNTWRVRASDKPIIHSGWRAFAHDHDLREGDHLCFNLTHPSHFVVDVLDGNGEVKGTALSATNTGKYTVASITNPCGYVRRSRKRKNSTTAMSPSPRRSRDGFGYGVTIASRCKTTARRRMNYPLGVGMKATQWVSHEGADGHEVVTILDSDDEQENRLLDNIQLSFGSAQVQSYRTSKIQRLVEYMAAQGEYVPQWSIPTDDHRTVGVLEKINHQENIIGHSEEFHVAGASELMVSDGSMTALAMETLDSGTDPLACQAHAARDEEKEEDETHLKVDGNDMESSKHGTIDSEALESHGIPEHESHATLGLLTEIACDPSQELATPNGAIISAKAHGEAGGEFLFTTLQNIVDMPVIADPTSYGGPLMRDLIIQGLAKKNFDTRVTDGDAENEDSILQSASSHKSSVQPSHGHGYVAAENTQYSLHFLQPPKPTVSHPRRHGLEFKHFLVPDSPKTPESAHEKIKLLQTPPVASADICVLKSNRGKVGNLDREKTLRAAHAWTKKLRNPNFVAVMQTSNVYHDFILDIPGEFARKSRLPATQTKAMLICDEVPTTCRAVWEGSRLDARGWMEFSRTHYLEEGDVCVLELHNRVAVRIGVHVFRLVGLRRSLLDWTQHYNVVHLGTPPFAEATVQPGSTPAAALQVL